jgi:hypothetical protein
MRRQAGGSHVGEARGCYVLFPPLSLNPRFVDARSCESPVTHRDSRRMVESPSRCGPGRAESLPCQPLRAESSWTFRGLRLRGGKRTQHPRALQRGIHLPVDAYPLILSVPSTAADRRLAIHGHGHTINPESPPHRRRLNQQPIHAPPGKNGSSVTSYPSPHAVSNHLDPIGWDTADVQSVRFR